MFSKRRKVSLLSFAVLACLSAVLFRSLFSCHSQWSLARVYFVARIKSAMSETRNFALNANAFDPLTSTVISENPSLRALTIGCAFAWDKSRFSAISNANDNDLMNEMIAVQVMRSLLDIDDRRARFEARNPRIARWLLAISPHERCRYCVLNEWLTRSRSKSMNELSEWQRMIDAIWIDFVDGVGEYLRVNCRAFASDRASDLLIAKDFSQSLGMGGRVTKQMDRRHPKSLLLIVGASISGAIEGLSSLRSEANKEMIHEQRGRHRLSDLYDIAMIDKRAEYRRDQWFDLIDAPFYRSIETLRNLTAIDTQYKTLAVLEDGDHAENDDNHERRGIRTLLLSSQILERYLAKTFAIVRGAVEIRERMARKSSQWHRHATRLIDYSVEYYGFCQNKTWVVIGVPLKEMSARAREIIAESKSTEFECVDRAHPRNDLKESLIFKRASIALRRHRIGNISSISISIANDTMIIDDWSKYLMVIDAKLMIASDGARSRVRQSIGIDYRAADSVNISRFFRGTAQRRSAAMRRLREMTSERGKNGAIRIQDLAQYSILLNFEAPCPRLRSEYHRPSRRDANNRDNFGHFWNAANRASPKSDTFNPWQVSLELSDDEHCVDAVFERFYRNDCQMQVLFSHDCGTKLAKSVSFESGNYSHSNLLKSARLLNVLFDVVKFHIDQNANEFGHIEKIDDFLSTLSKPIDGTGMIMLKNELRKASEMFAMREKIEEERKERCLILLSGDAAMRAHYRLGVGVNAILDGYHRRSAFYSSLAAIAMIADDDKRDALLFGAFQEMGARRQRRINELIELQTSTMMLESRCRLVIFFDSDRLLAANAALLDAQMPFDRDFSNNRFVELGHRGLNRRLLDCIIDNAVSE